MRVLVTPAVYLRVFEILTALTFGALRKNHIVLSIFEDIKKNKKWILVVHVRSKWIVKNTTEVWKSMLREKNLTSMTVPKNKMIAEIVDVLPLTEFIRITALIHFKK